MRPRVGGALAAGSSHVRSRVSHADHTERRARLRERAVAWAQVPGRWTLPQLWRTTGRPCSIDAVTSSRRSFLRGPARLTLTVIAVVRSRHSHHQRETPAVAATTAPIAPTAVHQIRGTSRGRNAGHAVPVSAERLPPVHDNENATSPPHDHTSREAVTNLSLPRCSLRTRRPCRSRRAP